MKKSCLYILLLLLVVISSCTNDDMLSLVDTGFAEEKLDNATDHDNSCVMASIPELIDGNAAGNALSRSSLYHDKTSDIMMFSWADSENMGVFTPDDKNTSPTFINFIRKAGQDNTKLNSIFEIESSVIEALSGETGYIAFRPFTSSIKQINYKAVDVSYTNQSNPNNVYRKYYYTYSDANDKKLYDDSEIAAGSHLGAYDYLVSQKQTTNDKGGVNFSLNRIGVVANFFIKCPDNDATFEQIQLVTQGDTHFTLTGTLDLTTREITPVTTHNVMTMKYGDDGLNMNNTLYQDSKGTGYIITYMMLAPVDLSENTSVNLYLVSHLNSNPSTKKYYKSTDLTTPTLTSNMFYRWRSANNNPDEPITFTEVTFQEFKEGTSINNGDSGSGTEGW